MGIIVSIKAAFQKRQAEEEPSQWGQCPKCGKSPRWLNVHKTHWCVCHEHRVKWCIGENLVSSWQDETPLEWERNRHLLAGYTEVEPAMPEVGQYSRLLKDDGRYMLNGKCYWARYLAGGVDSWGLCWQQGDGSAQFIAAGTDGRLWECDPQSFVRPTPWTVKDLSEVPEPEPDNSEMIPF